MLGQDATSPVWIHSVRDDNLVKELIPAILVTLIPVAIALLMQRPALRQALAMRAAQASKRFCLAQADWWLGMATRSTQAYNKARI